ncbi:HAMP domain-containing sensor histidine kinase [uncultured Pseudodesulfovibrio sp.]|uniref:sensor histidine kinase n=1 Tax=uncultured Pseudodesulfovibrio sp. TaxID=2035858 RepID=UPI0029C75E54|nr:HAMP domain-containing sensor histidine kinase [uncultured Pseudodesulfovibrio sp.]
MEKLAIWVETIVYATIIIGGTAYLISVDAFEFFYDFSRYHESYELDEIALAIPLALVCLLIFSVRRSWKLYRMAKTLREANDDLSDAYARIQALSRSKDTFISAASHELRSPLIGVANALQLRKMAKSEEEEREFFELAMEKAQFGLLLINDVLLYSQVIQGHSEKDLKPFNVRQTMDSIFASVERAAQDKGLELTVSVDEEVPDTVVSHEGVVRLVYVNVINNAIKYTENGRIAVHCTYTNTPRPELVFRSTDTGQGIAKDKIKAVFEPFNRGDDPARLRQDGVGLGLYMVKQLVQAMEGRVEVDSSVGVGTDFTVALPVSIC